MTRFRFKANPIALFLLSFCAAQMHAQAPPGYTLLYQDNFDGTHVNERDWSYRVDRRQLGTWVNGLDRAENVSEHDGALHIELRKERIAGKDEYTGGGLISKHQFGYGYYECLSRPFMAGKGAHTAFWQRGGAVANNTIFEIDSYEIDSGDFMGTNNLYMGLEPPDGKEEAWPLRSSEPWSFRPDGWYLDAFEYTPDGIIFYDNGKVAAHAEYRDLTAAQAVWLTALNGIRGMDESKQPGESVFKYFRYYAKDYPGINILPNGDFEYNQQAGPLIEPIAWQQQGTTGSSYVATGSAIHGNYFLRQGNGSQRFDVSTAQSLEYIMNGSYVLTAMVRSSGGQRVARITASGFGGHELTLDVPASSQWKQVTIPVVPVENHSVSITIRSQGEAGQWLEVDNIQFMKPPLAGQRPRDPEPFAFRRDPIWKAAQAYPLHYVGDGSFIMLAHNVGQGDAVSVTFKIAPDQMEDTSPIERAAKEGPSGWGFQLTSQGDIVFRIGSVTKHTDVVAHHGYAAGESKRITGVFDQGVASLYVDGKLAARQENVKEDTHDGVTAGKIGNTGDEYGPVGDITLRTGTAEPPIHRGKHFSGTISDIRIYNRALSEDEISKLGVNGDAR